MKKAILFLLVMPLGMIAQNITNTLGSGGKFIVEDNSNNDVLLINPGNIITEFVFGVQPAGFNPATNLPAGQYNFLSGSLFPSDVNILTASNSVTSGSFFQLIRERGSLNAPSILLAGDRIGTINFGAYSNPNWKTALTSISSNVVTVSGTSPALYSTNLTFQTTQTDGITENTMTFDNVGNLTVPGAVTSQAYRPSSISTTAGLNDQVIGIISTNGLDITVDLPPATSALMGKTYTIKKTGPENYSITVEPNGTEEIDGNPDISFGTNGKLEYITILCSGSAWFVIGQGDGF